MITAAPAARPSVRIRAIDEAEDMKLRAKRGKWNGGLSPYGRQVEDGQLKIVP